MLRQVLRDSCLRDIRERLANDAALSPAQQNRMFNRLKECDDLLTAPPETVKIPEAQFAEERSQLSTLAAILRFIADLLEPGENPVSGVKRLLDELTGLREANQRAAERQIAADLQADSVKQQVQQKQRGERR